LLTLVDQSIDPAPTAFTDVQATTQCNFFMELRGIRVVKLIHSILNRHFDLAPKASPANRCSTLEFVLNRVLGSDIVAGFTVLVFSLTPHQLATRHSIFHRTPEQICH
jgi:hypothetical protein